jgi:hypothetical protein
LLSFKIRQMLNELGKQPRPAVFLYDAEVFKNHAKPKSVERLRMCVNSLTGFSEISAWMGNVHGKRPTGVPHIQYSLPNMANPSIPVIKLDEKVDELANSPAHNTFLIGCKLAGKHFQRDFAVHHRVVGTIHSPQAALAQQGFHLIPAQLPANQVLGLPGTGRRQAV